MPYKVLAVLCAASFMGPFMGSAFNLALPKIAQDFSFKAVTLTWFATAFMISTAIFQIPFARLGDIFGRKRIYLAGLLGLSLSTLACPFAPSGNILIVLRFFSGVFSAMMFSSSIAIVVSVTPPDMRAKALALNTASVYAALATGPVVGGFLTQHLGWQSIFFVSAGLVACTWLLSRLFIQGEWVEAKGAAFDFPGSIIFAAALLGLIYGFSSLPHVQGIASIMAGALALAVFIVFEQKIASPLLDVRLFFTNRIFSLSCLAALINYAANSAVIFLISLYLQYVKGLTPSSAGTILITQALLQVCASLAAGRLSARHDPAKLATIGMILSALGLCGMIFLSAQTSLPYLALCLVTLGVGFGLFSSPNTNIIMNSVDKKHYGQASATTGTMRLVGQAFSMGIAAMSISIFVGNHPITPALFPRLITSFKLTFGIFIGLNILGAWASLGRSQTPKERPVPAGKDLDQGRQ